MKNLGLCLLVLGYICFSSYDVYAMEKQMISGPEEVLIPNAMESVAQYKAAPDYQFQVVNREGIALDKDGLLTITKEAVEQELIIQAKYGNKMITKKVNLHYSWSKTNIEYKDYQIKEEIKDIDINPIFKNQTVMSIIRISFLGMAIFIVILYGLKKGGNK